MSILSVDFGSVYTRAVLIDLVEGTYQLVARAETRTTNGFPVNDVTVGLARVIREIGEITGRTLMTDTGKLIQPEKPDRSGVDTFTATASLGRPLRAVVVGLVPNVSVASALRAAAGTYVDVAATINLDDKRSDEGRLNAILLNYPDVILLTGGTENGAEAALMDMVKIVRLAVSLTDAERRPTVIFAGNSSVAPAITQMFEGLTKVLIAPNIRPSLEAEDLDAAQAQLGQAFDLYKEERSQDFKAIAQMSASGVMPTAGSYNTVINYLAQTQREGVLAVDVGSAASVLSAAVNGQVATAIRTDLGLGHNAVSLFETLDIDQIRAWLPFNLSLNDIRNYVANKMLRPVTIPATLRELYLEHALLRVAIMTLFEAARPNWETDDQNGREARFETIIGAGAALNGIGHAGYTAMLLLDALQPVGVANLYTDPYALLPALGAVAAVRPEAVVQVLDGDNLEPLGTSFNLSGAPRVDKNAINVKITRDDGEVIEHTVLGGHLWVYPLPAGRTATAQVTAARGISFNGKRRVEMRVKGGTAGIIIDARGRPLPLARDAAGRAAQMPVWISDATGDPVLPIDPQWLKPVEEDAYLEDLIPKRRGLFRRGRGQLRGDQFRLDELDRFSLDEVEAPPTPQPEEESSEDDMKALRDALS